MTRTKRTKHILFGILTLLAVPPASAAVNINTATAVEPEVLPGTGPTKTKAIVAYRQQNGQFKTVEDLKKVKSIGEGIFSKLKDEVPVAPPAVKKAVPTMKQQQPCCAGGAAVLAAVVQEKAGTAIPALMLLTWPGMAGLTPVAPSRHIVGAPRFLQVGVGRKVAGQNASTVRCQSRSAQLLIRQPYHG